MPTLCQHVLSLCTTPGVNPCFGNLLTGDEKDQIHLLILFTSERGLCGGFNSIVTRTLRDKIENLIDQNKTVKIVCVGKTGSDILKRQYSEMITEVIDMRAVKSITYQDAYAK